MARSLWKGLVNFGLVNIPVELHPGSRDHTPRFRLLHRTDLSPIKMERVCQTDGKPVAWDDLVKGYEIEPGQFVAVTQDDFKTAALERSRSIDITAFVPLDAIDARYWDTPYLAVPGKGAEHSYALLAEALQKSGRAGIAKYVMRQRQHLAALVAVDGRLVVSTMRFPEDLVALPEAPAKPKLAARERELAAQLIEGMAAARDPDQYRDDYVPALMKVIEAKAEGAPVKAPKGKPAAPTNVSDLVARLRASLEAAGQSGGGKTPERKRAVTRRKPARSTRKTAAAKPRKRVA
ncbi:MAG: Ku protein [Acidobacteria bacterium]|nr:Ku protein [Acidobacteriota bacterium]